MTYLEIEKVVGREILDSRGNPTVEAEVTLIVDGTVGRGTAQPVHQQVNLRHLSFVTVTSQDISARVFTKAVENINTKIRDSLQVWMRLIYMQLMQQ